MGYSANFLWGFPDDSKESIGYEFANAKTEQYQKKMWEALLQKIKDEQREQILNEETAKDLPVCECDKGNHEWNPNCPIHREY